MQLHHLTTPFSTAMVSWQPTGELEFKFVLKLDGSLIIVRVPLTSVPHFVATHLFGDILDN